MDRFDLYELCTQTPERDVALLRAIHGGTARVLGEDFAGTGALAHAWARTVRGGRSIATAMKPMWRPKAATILALGSGQSRSARPWWHA